MSNPNRISQSAWLALPLCAVAFLLATLVVRVRRIDFVSDVAGRPAAQARAAARAEAWQPRLIVPGHHNESYEWLDQTRQMFDRGEWRVRHIDYENAQTGRDVYAPSPYRWYLGLAALCHHQFTGAPIGASVEWAALYADPLLLVIAGAATAVFVGRRFGLQAGAMVGAAFICLYPFAAEFLPGIPDDEGLALVVALWSVLSVVTGTLEAGRSGPEGLRRWFIAGGILGGLGLWVSVSWTLPILLGIGLGGLAASALARFRAAPGVAPGPLPWMTWALSGAVTCLAAYVAEYFPSHMGAWELRVIHPLFGVFWLGLGGLVALGTGRIQASAGPRGLREVISWVLAASAAASLPVAMRLTHSLAFLSVDLPTMRLSLQAQTAAAPSLWAWLLQNGFTGTVWATLLPLLILVPAGLLLFSRSVPSAARVPVALAVGPVLVSLGFAFRQISWWNGVDLAVLSLLAALAAVLPTLGRPAWVGRAASAGVVLLLAIGAFQLWPSSELHASEGLSESEAIGLVERDLAFWLSRHVGSGPAVALAPPNVTATLYYYAGIRGLGNFGWEDRDGLQAAVRIVSASTPEEAQELIGSHGVTHLIMPLWDPYLDAFAQIGEGQLEGTFLARLHKWNLPPWLKPVPYPQPGIAGFENQPVIILEVVDEQDDASALSNIAVYLADMGQFELALKAANALRRFPGDFGAQLARAEVQGAAGQADDFNASVDSIVHRLSSGADRQLQWDQRIGLAIMLAQTRHIDLARAQIKKCIGDVDAPKLRSLSTSALFRFQILRRALRLEIDDPALRALSFDLLPADLRSRVE